MTNTITLYELNQMCRETLDRYYKTHTADDFFMIDSLLNVCTKNNLTNEHIPTLTEMQNVILMG